MPEGHGAQQQQLNPGQIREARASTNFGHLYDKNPLMALYGANAESQLLGDANTCLFKCRKFSEELARDLAYRFNLKTTGARLHDNLTVLESNGCLTPQAAVALRFIQEYGNKAVHSHFNDREVAFRAVYICFQLGDMYCRLLDDSAPKRRFVDPSRSEESASVVQHSIDIDSLQETSDPRSGPTVVNRNAASEEPQSGRTIQSPLQREGTFGPYRLINRIAAGGMGEVFRAYNEQTRRNVALKQLSHNGLADKNLSDRFASEAVITSMLNHPNIVKVFDWGNINGRPFIEMELIEGRTLEDVLRPGPLIPDRAVKIVAQIASALDAAHAADITHRDVKPSNIMIGPDDHAYLLDFGIARLPDAPKLTAVNTVVGSVHYMAPERIRGAVDRANRNQIDIYSLTCVLHECLTGMPPYRGTEEEITYQHFYIAPPQPSSQVSDLGIGFDDVISAGMHKNPQDRYVSARDLAGAAQAALKSTKFISARTDFDDKASIDPYRDTPDTQPKPSPPGPRKFSAEDMAEIEAAVRRAAEPMSQTDLDRYRRDLVDGINDLTNKINEDGMKPAAKKRPIGAALAATWILGMTVIVSLVLLWARHH